MRRDNLNHPTSLAIQSLQTHVARITNDHKRLPRNLPGEERSRLAQLENVSDVKPISLPHDVMLEGVESGINVPGCGCRGAARAVCLGVEAVDILQDALSV